MSELKKSFDIMGSYLKKSKVINEQYSNIIEKSTSVISSFLRKDRSRVRYAAPGGYVDHDGKRTSYATTGREVAESQEKLNKLFPHGQRGGMGATELKKLIGESADETGAIGPDSEKHPLNIMKRFLRELGIEGMEGMKGEAGGLLQVIADAHSKLQNQLKAHQSTLNEKTKFRETFESAAEDAQKEIEGERNKILTPLPSGATDAEKQERAATEARIKALESGLADRRLNIDAITAEESTAKKEHEKVKQYIERLTGHVRGGSEGTLRLSDLGLVPEGSDEETNKEIVSPISHISKRIREGIKKKYGEDVGELFGGTPDFEPKREAGDTRSNAIRLFEDAVERHIAPAILPTNNRDIMGLISSAKNNLPQTHEGATEEELMQARKENLDFSLDQAKMKQYGRALVSADPTIDLSKLNIGNYSVSPNSDLQHISKVEGLLHPQILTSTNTSSMGKDIVTESSRQFTSNVLHDALMSEKEPEKRRAAVIEAARKIREMQLGLSNEALAEISSSSSSRGTHAAGNLDLLSGQAETQAGLAHNITSGAAQEGTKGLGYIIDDLNAALAALPGSGSTNLRTQIKDELRRTP